MTDDQQELPARPAGINVRNGHDRRSHRTDVSISGARRPVRLRRECEFQQCLGVIDTATNTVTATASVGSVARSRRGVQPGRQLSLCHHRRLEQRLGDRHRDQHRHRHLNRCRQQTVRGLRVQPGGHPRLRHQPFLGSSVSVIDTATNTVTATVPVGSIPVGIAITPNSAFAYVAHQAGWQRCR